MSAAARCEYKLKMTLLGDPLGHSSTSNTTKKIKESVKLSFNQLRFMTRLITPAPKKKNKTIKDSVKVSFNQLRFMTRLMTQFPRKGTIDF